ncbi:uncharacterized protein LOC143195673 [Rhynchophorus ferrugineus]|uniref:uncharacterized protein LOC143195673 n=1 Tax=Rhynchophorus ferrugineus TaxID=354439 RepID=UPI003FCCE873
MSNRRLAGETAGRTGIDRNRESKPTQPVESGPSRSTRYTYGNRLNRRRANPPNKQRARHVLPPPPPRGSVRDAPIQLPMRGGTGPKKRPRLESATLPRRPPGPGGTERSEGERQEPSVT